MCVCVRAARFLPSGSKERKLVPTIRYRFARDNFLGVDIDKRRPKHNNEQRETEYRNCARLTHLSRKGENPLVPARYARRLGVLLTQAPGERGVRVMRCGPSGRGRVVDAFSPF